MKYVFLGLFIADSLVHLYASYVDNKKLRSATKGAILLLLALYYIAASPAINWLVVAALAFSLLGDILLMFRGLGFALGGISFGFSHICFILIYIRNTDFSRVLLWAPIAAAIVYGTVIFFVMRTLHAHIPKKLFVPMLIYLCVNGVMNVFALSLLLSAFSTGTLLIYCGAICFFISDCVLFFVRFSSRHHIWKKHFPVMLTYIAAEFLIVSGFLMLGI